jgi:hypothetical protein
MLFKPQNPKNNNDDIDEAQISQDWNDVYVNLLIGLQSLDVDTWHPGMSSSD